MNLSKFNFESGDESVRNVMNLIQFLTFVFRWFEYSI
jgi:hypothetical protein